MKLNEALRKVGRDAFTRGYLWRLNEEHNGFQTGPEYFNSKALATEFDKLVKSELRKKK